MLPFAYGGPSWSTNLGNPLRRSRILPYRFMDAHRASACGSLVGRLAFIGNSVRGRFTVSFHSGMGIYRFYNEREWTCVFQPAGKDGDRQHSDNLPPTS